MRLLVVVSNLPLKIEIFAIPFAIGATLSARSGERIDSGRNRGAYLIGKLVAKETTANAFGGRRRVYEAANVLRIGAVLLGERVNMLVGAELRRLRRPRLKRL
jgi:hypothetical protein